MKNIIFLGGMAAPNFLLGGMTKLRKEKLSNSYSTGQFRRNRKDVTLAEPGRWTEVEYNYYDLLLSKK